MTPKKTLLQREAEMRAMLATPWGRAALRELEARYAASGGGIRSERSSLLTYLLVYERTRGLIEG
jgi:hypothetical protein